MAQHQGEEHDYELVAPLTHGSQCSVCLQTLQDPHLVSCCGHNFCVECISRIQRDRKPCPLCKQTGFTTMANQDLRRALNSSEVRCSHREQGCEWVGELWKLGRHLNANPQAERKLQGCPFTLIECIYCKDHIKRRVLAEHQNERCPNRPYTCEYCEKFESTFDRVAKHWNKCKFYLLPCPNKCHPSGSGIERQNLEHHVNEECPLTVMECDFHYAGCGVKLPRKDMAVHMREEALVHMSLLTAMNQKLATQLLERDEQLQAQQDIISAQAQQLSCLEENLNQKLMRNRTELEEKLKEKIRLGFQRHYNKLEESTKQTNERIELKFQEQNESVKLKFQEHAQSESNLTEEIRLTSKAKKKLEENIRLSSQRNSRALEQLEQRTRINSQWLLMHLHEMLDEKPNRKELQDMLSMKGAVVAALLVLIVSVVFTSVLYYCMPLHREHQDLANRVTQHHKEYKDLVGRVTQHYRQHQDLVDRVTQQYREHKDQVTQYHREHQNLVDSVAQQQSEYEYQVMRYHREHQDMVDSVAQHYREYQDMVDIILQMLSLQTEKDTQVAPIDVKLCGVKLLQYANIPWYITFYTHTFGYKIHLKVAVNGRGDGEGTHVSVFTQLIHGEFDSHLDWPFRGTINIQLLSQDDKHYTRTITYTETTPDEFIGQSQVTAIEIGDEWGRQMFIPHSELDEYLQDDCLDFRVQVSDLMCALEDTCYGYSPW